MGKGGVTDIFEGYFGHFPSGDKIENNKYSDSLPGLSD